MKPLNQVVCLLAASGVLVPVSVADAKLRLIGQARGSGQFSVATASGSVNGTAKRLYIKVTAPGRQRVSVSWNRTCSNRSGGAGSSSGSYGTRSDRRRRIPVPRGNVDCILAASASGRGTLRVKLYALT